MASTAGVPAAGTGLVVFSASITAVDSAFALHAFFDVNDADAVAACAFHTFDGHAHGTTPLYHRARLRTLLHRVHAWQPSVYVKTTGRA